MACILQSDKDANRLDAAMMKVIDLVPVTRLSDEELDIRQWEAVMAAGYGSAEHQMLAKESARRLSGAAPWRPQSVH